MDISSLSKKNGYIISHVLGAKYQNQAWAYKTPTSHANVIPTQTKLPHKLTLSNVHVLLHQPWPPPQPPPHPAEMNPTTTAAPPQSPPSLNQPGAGWPTSASAAALAGALSLSAPPPQTPPLCSPAPTPSLTRQTKPPGRPWGDSEATKAASDSNTSASCGGLEAATSAMSTSAR